MTTYTFTFGTGKNATKVTIEAASRGHAIKQLRDEAWDMRQFIDEDCEKPEEVAQGDEASPFWR